MYQTTSTLLIVYKTTSTLLIVYQTTSTLLIVYKTTSTLLIVYKTTSTLLIVYKTTSTLLIVYHFRKRMSHHISIWRSYVNFIVVIYYRITSYICDLSNLEWKIIPSSTILSLTSCVCIKDSLYDIGWVKNFTKWSETKWRSVVCILLCHITLNII